MSNYNISPWFHRSLTKIGIYFGLLIFFVALFLIVILGIKVLCFADDDFLFHAYYFFGANPVDETKHSNTVWYLIIAILGFFIFNGLLITAFSSGVERYVERVRDGRKRFKLKNHYVMIGFNHYSSSVIEKLLEGNSDKLVILTAAKPSMVRSRLRAALVEQIDRRVIIYAGEGSADRHVSKLNLDAAKAVYIMAEGNEWENQYTQSMSLLKEVAGYAGDRSVEDGTLLPVSVFVNDVSAFDLVQRLDIPQHYFGTTGESGRFVQNLNVRIFNFYDNWARLLWSYKGKRIDGEYQYDALDFEPIENTDKHVHLVIVGFNQMGRALALEAFRVCHYPNFDDATGKNKTLITIVDPLAEKLERQWMAQYPHVAQIADIEMRFVGMEVEHPDFRAQLAGWANDKAQMLTIAICPTDPDVSMNIALSLPEQVYFDYNKLNLTPKDASAPDGKQVIVANPARVRVLVRQNIKTALDDIIKNTKHYSNVKPFGSFLDGFDLALENDDLAICVNGVYDTYWSLIESESGGTEIIAALRELIGNRAQLNELFAKWREKWQRQEAISGDGRKQGIPESHRIASRLQVDQYRTLLGILARSRDNDDRALATLKEQLAHAEHRRWVAEHTMAGWRQARADEKRVDEVRIHTGLIPHSDLPKSELHKDTNVIEFAETLAQFANEITADEN